MLAVIMVVTASACGEGPDAPGDTPAQAQWSRYAQIADEPEVTLNWRDRPAPPDGFTEQDIDTFAKIEVALITKSISKKVANMSPNDAVGQVMSGLEASTKDDYESNVPPNPPGKHAWEWYMASLYKGDLIQPAKIIRVDWDTDSRMGKLDNGTSAPLLSLTLQVFAVHTFGPADHPRSVVVRRAVKLSGFKPNGGTEWWPGLGSKTTAFGNDGCSLSMDSTLRPLKTAKYVKKDLAALRKAWAIEGVATWDEKDSKPNPKAAKKYAAFCAKHPDGA